MLQLNEQSNFNQVLIVKKITHNIYQWYYVSNIFLSAEMNKSGPMKQEKWNQEAFGKIKFKYTS